MTPDAQLFVDWLRSRGQLLGQRFLNRPDGWDRIRFFLEMDLRRGMLSGELLDCIVFMHGQSGPFDIAIKHRTMPDTFIHLPIQ